MLANIEPSHIRRLAALAREAKKIYSNTNLPIHEDINGRVDVRLKSRKPLWIKLNDIDFRNYDKLDDWTNQWNELSWENSDMITDPTVMLPGLELPRFTWSQLNRIRTNHGRCNAMLHKWDPGISPACDCGCDLQTIRHLIEDCPMRKFTGELKDFFNVTDSALQWLSELDVVL